MKVNSYNKILAFNIKTQKEKATKSIKFETFIKHFFNNKTESRHS